MVYCLFLPILSILLIALQIAVADILFSGRLVIELSLIAVIYAGFRLDMIKGAALAFVFGFIFDCLVGSVTGLFTFIYILIFVVSFVVSFVMDTDKLHFVALFGFLCSLIEQLLVVLFYNLLLQFDAAFSIPFVLLPQAMLIGLFTPIFFYLMRRLEVFVYGKPFHRIERSGDSRISAEI
jgi:rod shape-determining protein MreD